MNIKHIIKIPIFATFHQPYSRDTSFITKQGAVKKKMHYLFQHQGHTNKIDSEYLEFMLTQVT